MASSAAAAGAGQFASETLGGATANDQSFSKACEIIAIDVGSWKMIPTSRASVVDGFEKFTEPIKALFPSAIIIFACVYGSDGDGGPGIARASTPPSCSCAKYGRSNSGFTF